MVNYKNILYCTDYSEDAGIALIHAIDFAQRYDAKLHILHVLDSIHRYTPPETTEGRPQGTITTATPQLAEQVLAEIKEKLKNEVKEVANVVWRVIPGVPFVEIVRYARENEVDLIVMGTTGNSDLAPTTYGSTVENVSRRAHCHVMAIRNPERAYTL